MPTSTATVPVAATRRPRISLAHLALLVALYCAQGIPFGFAILFVPLQIAHRPDFTYSKATLIGLAGLPWFLKLAWAASVDTRYVDRVGRRKSWILPAQAMLALIAFGASGLDFSGPMWMVAATIAALNLCAAVQDTAVDALAVDMLSAAERGLGNAAQVGGYKVGMLLGGSGLVWVAAQASTQAAMLTLGGAVLVLMTAPLLYREPPPPPRAELVHHREQRAIGTLLADMSAKAWLPTVLFVGTVKVGESMVGTIIKPFLVRESHFSDERAAFAVGLVGGVLSLTGSALGGWASGPQGRTRLLAYFGIFQGLTVALLGLAVWLDAGSNALIAAIGLEHFGVGLLTPVLFAYMMDVTDPAIGALQYTLLATLELAAKSVGSIAAGPLAQALGAAPLMVLAGTVGALPLLLLPFLRQPHRE